MPKQPTIIIVAILFLLIFCFLFFAFYFWCLCAIYWIKKLFNCSLLICNVFLWFLFGRANEYWQVWCTTVYCFQWMFFERQFNYNSIFGHKRLCMIILRVFAPFQSKMWAISSIWITFIVCISTLGIDKHLRAKTIEYWIWYYWIEIEWIKWVFNILRKFHYT